MVGGDAGRVATVSNAHMASYLERFHAVYIDTADRFVDDQLRPHLLRYSKMPTAVIGMVSTQHGAGFEYVEGEPRVSVVSASRPVEEMLFSGIPPAVRRGSPMFSLSHSTGASIGKLTVSGGFPVRIEGRSDLRLYEMASEGPGWRRAVEYAELHTDRSAEYWSDLMAVERAKDEVLLAVLDARLMRQRSLSLSDYLAHFKQRHVLLLGDFGTEGRERLARLRERVDALGYVTVTIDEVDEFPDLDLRKKLLAVATACRFVVVDDSSRSGQAAELPLIELARVIALVLRKEGSDSTFVTRGLSIASRVIREVAYTDTTFDDVVDAGMAWAEAERERIGAESQDVYLWRQE